MIHDPLIDFDPQFDLESSSLCGHCSGLAIFPERMQGALNSVEPSVALDPTFITSMFTLFDCNFSNRVPPFFDLIFS